MLSSIGLKGSANRGGKQAQSENDQSLTTILRTREDLASLLLLIAGSMDAMRSKVLDIFDANKQGDIAPVKLESAQENDQLQVSNDRPAEEPPPSEEHTQIKSQDIVKNELETPEKVLSRPEIIQLKQAALDHFDSWREGVLQRVGEAVNQHEPEGEEHHDPTNQGPSQQKISDDLANLQKVYPPEDTPLRQLDEPRRALILHSLLLLLLSLETYKAESRILLLQTASSLFVPPRVLADIEATVAKGLLEAAKQMNADNETQKKIQENSTARKWKVGLGAAAGAVLIGVTGGLAAPLLAAGLGTVMGGLGLGATATAGYLGALASSGPLIGILFGAYGGNMTGKMVEEYAKQVEDFAFVPVNQDTLLFDQEQDQSSRQLRVAIGISGWLKHESEVVKPWQVFSGQSTEVFALRWELEALLSLGHALLSYVGSYAWGWARSEIIRHTIFAAVTSAIALPIALAKSARVVDNPFSVARSRSEKAGVVLADALINKVQGERPVTLLGYSLGSRVIYSCLIELAKRQAFGLVESVCLVGAPVPSDPIVWRKMRSVVAGRVVNVYSTKDYLLGFLYRTSSLQLGIAGLRSISDVQGIENFDVSDLVDGHTQYRFLIGAILQRVGLEDIDPEAVKVQMQRFQHAEDKIKQERKKYEAEGQMPDPEADGIEMEVDQQGKPNQTK